MFSLFLLDFFLLWRGPLDVLFLFPSLVPQKQFTIHLCIASHRFFFIKAGQFETLVIFMLVQEVVKNLACLVILKELFSVALIESE